MKDRVKQIRKSLNLTMKDFGQRIGISNVAISQIESGKNTPSDQTIRSICREFNVNEIWLRTGEGTPYTKQSRENEIQTFINRIFSNEPESFRTRFISALCTMNESGWDALEKVLDELSAGLDRDADKKQKINIDAMVDEYRRQLELEVRQMEKSSASNTTDDEEAANE